MLRPMLFDSETDEWLARIELVWGAIVIREHRMPDDYGIPEGASLTAIVCRVE